jgi:choline dehydrogenase
MGDPNGAHTVLDPDCRVLGVENLRVIDASSMPSMVRANLNLTVIAMAELMAARIQQNA